MAAFAGMYLSVCTRLSDPPDVKAAQVTHCGTARWVVHHNGSYSLTTYIPHHASTSLFLYSTVGERRL